MTAGTPQGSGSRAVRAIALFAGAALLGPSLPALAFAAMAEIGGRLEGPHTRPLLSFASTLSIALSFAFSRGGGVTAALSGALLALLVVWRGVVSAFAVSAVVTGVAGAVAIWADRRGPRHEAVFLVLAFVLVAVVTANILYCAAVRWRVLSRE